MTPVEIQRHLIAFNVLRGGLGDYGIRADGVRDDDGAIGPRTRRAVQAFQRAVGLEATGEIDATLIAALRREVSRLHQDVPSLGLRALAIAFQEWIAGVQEEPLGSNTGPRIREYFEVCERDGKPVRLRAGEWCAAAASWCTKQALQVNEKPPHGFRVAGVELENDLKSSGFWAHVDDVKAGRYVPRAGDLVVLTRDGSWTRHICRLVAWHVDGGFWTLGGNESNRWKLTFRRIEDGQLLGFGAYPQS